MVEGEKVHGWKNEQGERNRNRIFEQHLLPQPPPLGPTNLLLESLEGDADVKLVRVGLNGALLHLSNGLLGGRMHRRGYKT